MMEDIGKYDTYGGESAPKTDKTCPRRAKDNWQHRSWGMKCRTCIWFVQKSNPETGVYNLGRCRRHAPTMSGFPVVFNDDWCGDHKIDESKI